MNNTSVPFAVKMENERKKYASALDMLKLIGVTPTTTKNYGLYIQLYEAGYYWSDNLLCWMRWAQSKQVGNQVQPVRKSPFHDDADYLDIEDDEDDDNDGNDFVLEEVN